MQRALPEDYYTVTCVNSQTENNIQTIVWQVDTGEYSYQSLIETYPLNKFGYSRLKKLFSDIGLEYYDDVDDPFYNESFIGIRAQVKVSIVPIDSTTITNKIIAFSPALGRPEYNVLKKPDKSFFYKKQNAKKLPLE